MLQGRILCVLHAHKLSVASSVLSGTASVLFSPCTPLREVDYDELVAEK